MMHESASSATSADADVDADADAVPTVDFIDGRPSSSGRVQAVKVQDDAETVGRRRLAPDAGGEGNSPGSTGPRHSRWGKLRQTVKATTMFASTVSDVAAGPPSTRSSRHKPGSKAADERRDSFLKRFSTRQTSCGTSYLQPSTSVDGTMMSNSNLEPDKKV